MRLVEYHDTASDVFAARQFRLKVDLHTAASAPIAHMCPRLDRLQQETNPSGWSQCRSLTGAGFHVDALLGYTCILKSLPATSTVVLHAFSFLSEALRFSSQSSKFTVARGP